MRHVKMTTFCALMLGLSVPAYGYAQTPSIQVNKTVLQNTAVKKHYIEEMEAPVADLNLAAEPAEQLMVEEVQARVAEDISEDGVEIQETVENIEDIATEVETPDVVEPDVPHVPVVSLGDEVLDLLPMGAEEEDAEIADEEAPVAETDPLPVPELVEDEARRLLEQEVGVTDEADNHIKTDIAKEPALNIEAAQDAVVEDVSEVVSDADTVMEQTVDTSVAITEVVEPETREEPVVLEDSPQPLQDVLDGAVVTMQPIISEGDNGPTAIAYAEKVKKNIIWTHGLPQRKPGYKKPSVATPVAVKTVEAEIAVPEKLPLPQPEKKPVDGAAVIPTTPDTLPEALRREIEGIAAEDNKEGAKQNAQQDIQAETEKLPLPEDTALKAVPAKKPVVVDTQAETEISVQVEEGAESSADMAQDVVTDAVTEVDTAEDAVDIGTILGGQDLVTEQPAELSLLFQGDGSDVTADMKKTLDVIMQRLDGDKMIRVQLHAFATGVDGNPSSARRISLSRALAVREYLVKQGGLRPTRMDVRALGDQTQEQPIDRIDFVFVR